MAVNLSITGFSDKIYEFASIYIQLLFDCAKEKGFEANSVKHSIQKKKSVYANNNIEPDDKATHHRILMLIPHTFHDKLIE